MWKDTCVYFQKACTIYKRIRDCSFLLEFPKQRTTKEELTQGSPRDRLQQKNPQGGLTLVLTLGGKFFFFFFGSTHDPIILFLTFYFLFPSHREPGNALEITMAQDDICNLLEHPPSVGGHLWLVGVLMYWVVTPGFRFSGREPKPKPGPF